MFLTLYHTFCPFSHDLADFQSQKINDVAYTMCISVAYLTTLSAKVKLADICLEVVH